MSDDIKEYLEKGNISSLFAGLYGETYALALKLANLSHIFAEMNKPTEEIVVLFPEEI